jgi:hypothetical protein
MGWPESLTIYKLVTDWGSLIGGVFTLVAGALAYFAGMIQATATRQAAAAELAQENEQNRAEVETLRKSLGLELRQLTGQAIGAHRLLVSQALAGSQITARMIENWARIPQPVIYPAVASRLGSISPEDAMGVIQFYHLLEIAREGTDWLLRSRTPDHVPPRMLQAISEAYLRASVVAAELLPKMRT